jgi:hypothetical protein
MSFGTQTIDVFVICDHSQKYLTAQRCHRHPCDMHSGVIETAVICTVI